MTNRAHSKWSNGNESNQTDIECLSWIDMSNKNGTKECHISCTLCLVNRYMYSSEWVGLTSSCSPFNFNSIQRHFTTQFRREISRSSSDYSTDWIDWNN